MCWAFLRGRYLWEKKSWTASLRGKKRSPTSSPHGNRCSASNTSQLQGWGTGRLHDIERPTRLTPRRSRLGQGRPPRRRTTVRRRVHRRAIAYPPVLSPEKHGFRSQNVFFGRQYGQATSTHKNARSMTGRSCCDCDRSAIQRQEPLRRERRQRQLPRRWPQPQVQPQRRQLQLRRPSWPQPRTS